MPYKLRDGLSFCRVDGRLVFLDLREDRYFRLSEPLENAVLACLDGNEAPHTEVDGLLRREILTLALDTDGDAPVASLETPSRSALECKTDAQKLDASTVMEVLGIVGSTRWQLKRNRFQDVVDKLAAYRNLKTATAPQPSAAPSEPALFRAAGAFVRARSYVPIDTSCLLDALSMVRFLARRRLFSNIVFGVTDRPFAAHCWVQSGDLVLNDTVGNATVHTPIRVV